MAEKTTFIKLDRNITEWGWYQDANTFRVFIHLLVRASFKDREYAGILLKRGEYITTHAKLADALGMSVRNVRTALEHLKSTGEVTITRHSNFLVISIKNYDFYQSDYESQQTSDKPLTDHQQTSDRPLTIKQERKEREERKERKEKKEASGETPEPPFFDSADEKQNQKSKQQEFQNMIENYTQNPELRETLLDFIDYRKKAKAGFSVKALKLNLVKLDSLASDDRTKIAVLNQSIECGWSGLFPLRTRTGRNSRERKDIIREQEMAEIHKYLELVD